jgi:hypothetical protein
MKPHQTYDRIDLIKGPVGLNPQIVLFAPIAGAERRRAIVAGTGIDAVENDHCPGS